MVHATLLAAGSLWAAAAAADDDASRWSLGMQLGQARGSAHAAESTAPLQTLVGDPSPASYDMSATMGGSNRFGWRVFTGYRITNYFAVHLGYTDLGTARTRLVDPAAEYSGLPSFERIASESVRGMDLSVQLKLPVTERIDVEVRRGQYYWSSHTRMPGPLGEFQREDTRSSKRDSDAFYGAGVEVSVINDLSATLGWTRYKVGEQPVGLWTVGALYRFGIY